MATFLYQCPLTARKVQGWAADEATASDAQTFLPITCLACGAVHLVNPETGKTAASEHKGLSR
jgi:hypothetical protein